MDPHTLQAVRPPHRTVELPGVGAVQVRAMTLSETRRHVNGNLTAWCGCVHGADGRELFELPGVAEETVNAALEAVLASPEPTLADRKLWRGASTEIRLEMDARLFAEEMGHHERGLWLLELLVRSVCRITGLSFPWKQAALDRLCKGGPA